MFASKNELFTRPSGYNISRSVRLRSSASAYFNRTPASASNRKTWTWSGWVKRGLISGSATYEVFSGDNGATSFTGIRFVNDQIYVQDFVSATKNIFWITNAVFRDPSAWYHVVVKYDTTQASSTNSVLVYINGVSQALTFTASTGSYVQNYDGIVNSTFIHKIGEKASANYFDGYLTEINFIDGTALTPSSFGSTNAITGVWQPAKYTGTYGTNGFYLNFSDNSAATAATIGKDYSGNANNWTPNNISVTAGTTYDSMLDVPTPYADGGNGRGNYCVLNPLDKNTNMASSSGNLDWVNAGATQYSTRSTIFPTSGKWYAEFTISSSSAIIAIANQNAVVQGANGLNGVFALTTFIYNNSGTAAQSGLASFAASDVIAVAYDADTNSVQFYRNNSTYGTAVTPSATGPFCFYVGANGSACTINANFGQRPFTYTPPSGYVALNTQNLPTPTISNGANYMAATTYTGTNATLAISNAVNSISFQPDWVWVKSRSGISRNTLFDSIRGNTKVIWTDSTDAEGTENAGTGLSSFNSNGFTLGTDIAGTNGSTNGNGTTYVAWQWKAGTTSSSNTNGSITSTVSVGATQGFSVVTYTGTGANATVGHGLGVAPKMIIAKSRSNAGGDSGIWVVYHASLTSASYFLYLNQTDAQTLATTVWNATAPTSTVFSIGTASGSGTASTHVAYCFSEIAGYSKFGSYTGNGSTDGPFVYCGFRPRWVLIKCSSTGGAGYEWELVDTSRNTSNVTNFVLYPNLSDAEATASSAILDITSNGFKLRGGANIINASSATYIYAAFAENPFKYSLAR